VTTTERPARARPERRSAAWLATLVAVPVTIALVLVAVVADRRGGADPTTPPATPAATAGALPAIKVAAPPALTGAAQQACQELISALPTTLGDRPARPVDSPSPYVVAWGEPAVTLRCGVPWVAERRGQTTAWTVVDRPVYVEVLVPAADASGPAARLSTAVTAALKPRPVDPAK
jgi:hypothetical protein